MASLREGIYYYLTVIFRKEGGGVGGNPTNLPDVYHKFRQFRQFPDSICIRHYNKQDEGKALAPPKDNERSMRSHFSVGFIDVPVYRLCPLHYALGG